MTVTSTPATVEPERPFGPAAAMMLAAGLGVFVLGLLTILAEAFTGIKDGLQFNDRVGPLSGKTIIAVATFVGTWALLSVLWRRSNPAVRTIVLATVALIALGLLLTFPSFFQLWPAE